MRLFRLTLLLLVATFLAAVARAQTVRWEPAEAGMPNTVQLVFENCAPDGQPDLPSIPGVTFTFLGQSESSQMVLNGGGFTRTRTVMLSYVVRSRQNTAVQIPGFTVKTDKGALRVPAFNAAAPAAPLDTVASAKLVPERTSVWAGEVFGLSYELSASRRTNPQISPTFDWNAAPLVAEDWSKPEVTEAVVGGERRLNVVFRTRAVAKAPNTLKLEAASHLLSIQTGTIGFGIISQPRMEQVSVTSDQPVIEVRTLPPPPQGFAGAVGQFKLTPRVVPEKAAVGEPVTWTLELTGTGNWPDIAGLPSRDVSNDFQVVQPKAKRTPTEGKLFDVSLAEDVVLVPTKPGSYTLGPVSFTYFDPKSGSYKTITAKPTTVMITAPNAPKFNIMPPATVATDEPPPPTAKKLAPPSIPAPPAGIPRDPLPGSDVVSTPLTARALTLGLLAPLAGVLALWMWLAVRRAKVTDPVRPRREAHDRLAKTLSHLPAPTERENAASLIAWQRDTAVLWQLSRAAPRAEELPDSAWAALWSEADRSLYGAKTALPADWVARAQEALAAKSLPGFKPLRLFLPQNLMPFAALMAFVFVSHAALLHAAAIDAKAAYAKADFATAEKGWRARIATAPTDWIARHNLSLALAQQERAPEAAAQATAAFVQRPGDPSVRWHFVLAAEKGGAVPQDLASFITPGPLQSVARFASPAVWQRTLIAVAWVLGAAIGWLLFNAYGRRLQLVRRGATTLLALGLLAGASAGTALHSYGLAAHGDAVVVARPTTLRSIPTEADAAQKTSPLAPGSIALADKTFLGWTQLAFENGQTGWVRKEDVVGLWK